MFYSDLNRFSGVSSVAKLQQPKSNKFTPNSAESQTQQDSRKAAAESFSQSAAEHIEKHPRGPCHSTQHHPHHHCVIDYIFVPYNVCTPSTTPHIARVPKTKSGTTQKTLTPQTQNRPTEKPKPECGPFRSSANSVHSCERRPPNTSLSTNNATPIADLRRSIVRCAANPARKKRRNKNTDDARAHQIDFRFGRSI